MAAISLTNVNQVFGSGTAQVQALTDVNFAAATGTLSLVMGPSGSGKSTFLSIAGGLLTPTIGEVTVDGKKYSGRSKKRSVTGYAWMQSASCCRHTDYYRT